MSGNDARIEPLGERALLVRIGTAVDLATSQAVHALHARLQATRPPAVREIVPAHASLAVLFAAGRDAAAVRAALHGWIEAALAHRACGGEGVGAIPAPVLLRVRYNGPDLDDLARHAGLTVDEVVRRHAAATYIVSMLGFAPGFPYLLGMDPALAMPRLATPRTQVAAGSVGIAGSQTGIYPQASPGGWRIIGHTDAPLFDAGRDPPALLAPGMRVQLVPRE